MITIIRLYPIIAICVAYIFIEFARNLRRKGKRSWILLVLIALLIVGSMVLWGVYRGDKHAEQWAKEWAVVTFLKYSSLV